MKQYKSDLCVTLVCVGIYLFALWKAIPFVYGIVDDRSMMEILSGQYLGKPDAHAIFLGYWYSLLLTGLYTCLPNVDWYALSYLTMQAGCMCLILTRSLGMRKEKGKKAVCAAFLLLAFTAFGLQAIVQISFTTTAAVLGVTAVYWYATSKKLCRKDAVILSVLLFLASQVRVDIFCMVVPVCAVLWFFRVAVQKDRSRMQYLMPVLVLCVCVSAVLGRQAGYGGSLWRAYQAHDNGRTAVYDYPDYTFPPYEEAEDFYRSVGVDTKSQAKALIYYNYTASDRVAPGFFQNYIEAYQRAYPSGESFTEKLAGSMKEYIRGVPELRFHGLHAAALALYAGLIVSCLRKRDWLLLGKALCVWGIQTAMWLYLIYQGRLPDRVVYSMNLMLLMTAALLCAEAASKGRVPARLGKSCAVAGLFLLCYLSGLQIAGYREKNLEMSRQNEKVESLKKYCMERPDNFYFNDVTSLSMTTYNVKPWRKDKYTMNYMSLGDWMSFSPVWQKKLDQKGIRSVKEALYEDDHVYLICNFEKGLQYLVSLYSDVQCKMVEHIPGFDIYSLESL